MVLPFTHLKGEEIVYIFILINKHDVEKSLFHFLFFFWTVWLQQNRAWFLGVRVFFVDFWEMVREEQTDPANQVNTHMVHPSLFTCFDLTFKGQGFVLSKGSQRKTITLSLSVSERQNFSCAGWSGAGSCIFFLQFFFLKQVLFFAWRSPTSNSVQKSFTCTDSLFVSSTPQAWHKWTRRENPSRWRAASSSKWTDGTTASLTPVAWSMWPCPIPTWQRRSWRSTVSAVICLAKLD